jgi:16S rRNA (cytidine1402-2'-O)-methyltransferase
MDLIPQYLRECYLSRSPRTLTLIPTPLWPSAPLEPVAQAMLEMRALDENVKIVCENAKVGRQILKMAQAPRETFDKLIEFNQQIFKSDPSHSTVRSVLDELLLHLKSGGEVFWFTDGGLPSFCDPGQEMIIQAHFHHIKIRMTPFANSALVALVLSGFVGNQTGDRFTFLGMLPQSSEARAGQWRQIVENQTLNSYPIVILETPYRLKKLWSEMLDFIPKRPLFLMSAIGSGLTEKYWRGSPESLNSQIDLNKNEFVLVLDGCGKTNG